MHFVSVKFGQFGRHLSISVCLCLFGFEGRWCTWVRRGVCFGVGGGGVLKWAGGGAGYYQKRRWAGVAEPLN